MRTGPGRTRPAALSAILVTAVLTGCSSGATTADAPNAPDLSGSPSSTAAGSVTSPITTGGTLVVTGSLALSLRPVAHTTTPCNVPNTGVTTGGLADHTSGSLLLTDGAADYILQFYLGPGTTTLPADFGTDSVALWLKADPTRHWSIGTNATSTQRGTITMVGKHGTIDADMAPDLPTPNPALAPIHVAGTFDCP